jgi:NAD(P)-dependent dehydrogenase (short-subunit alcohol dehydrogenase family)
MTRLDGKVCVVTGASSGIGEATTKALAGAGARVVLAARREERLAALGKAIRSKGGRATWTACDVTRVEDLERLRSHVDREHGRCDVLVNNAGVPGGGRFADLTLEQIETVTATNYLGVLYCTKVFLPDLLRSRGHVVNVASLAGRYALPGAAVYTAAKHAVVALSESLLCDTSLKGLKVTAVCPGFVKTPGFPHENPPWFLTITADQVAARIVTVIQRGEVGTICLPAWPGPLSAVQVLAPSLFRFASRLGARRYAHRVHSE